MKERLLGEGKEASNFKLKISNFKWMQNHRGRWSGGRLNCGNELKPCAGKAAQAVARCAVLNSQTLRSGLGICRAYGAE
jgi:hypothetical protein